MKEEPLFRASDIGLVLNISTIRSSIRDFSETQKVVLKQHTLGGIQEVSFLTEKGYGNKSEGGIKFKIYNKNDCLKFIEIMKNGCIIKFNQLGAFETFLNTQDKIIKEQMYFIINAEKH